MTPFIEGLIAGIAMLGGVCGFNYWMFLMMEKRLDVKLDVMASEIHSLITDMREERRSKDALYKFVLDNYKKT